MKVAKYKCLSCDFEWNQNPMAQYDSDGKFLGKTYANNCPLCNHAYIKWLNFKEFEK